MPDCDAHELADPDADGDTDGDALCDADGLGEEDRHDEAVGERVGIIGGSDTDEQGLGE